MDWEILACLQCGLRFVSPAGLQQAVDYDQLYEREGRYDGYLKTADALATDRDAPLNRSGRKALEIIRRASPRSLLEVGCGVGGFLRWAESLGVQTWGTDVSENALARARTYSKATLHHGILTDDVFDGRRFDVVCAWEVIEHISEPRSFVRALKQRLNPGGHLLLSTPNYESTWLWRSIETDPCGTPPVHVTFWSRKPMARILSDHAVEQIDLQRVSLPTSAAAQSRVPLARAISALDAAIRPSQRMTLFVHARGPADR